MNKYETLKGYKDEEFRRITGVKRATFFKMVAILEAAYMAKHMKRGRRAKLCIEDMLLATFEYLREYRTFALPGRKSLLKDDSEYEFLLIDATESPIERPKKNSVGTIPGRKNGTP